MLAMSDRIERLFAGCRKENRAAFIPYICAGDPNLSRTAELAIALEKAGADLLELGIPFSDPLADGIVNQLAAERALESGATVNGVLDCVRNIRARSEIPIVLYTYLNPIFQFGLAEFHRAAAAAGVDGLLILDWPPEEDSLDTDAIVHIRLIAPTTPTDRMAMRRSPGGVGRDSGRRGSNACAGRRPASGGSIRCRRRPSRTRRSTNS